MSRDAGVTYSEIDSSQVRDKPGLHSHTTLTSNFDVAGGSDLGLSFHFKLEAINVAGSLQSSSLSVVLADAPSTPTGAPTYDTSQSNSTQIRWQIAEVAATGGSPILSYSLEVDNGRGGDFVALYGAASNSMSTIYLLSGMDMRGNVFRARYRVRNAVGWSQYSPVA
jgi:hypothetical protein